MLSTLDRAKRALASQGKAVAVTESCTAEELEQLAALVDADGLATPQTRDGLADWYNDYLAARKAADDETEEG